ncbi:hypothetical protein JCM11641_003965 [Rhodosporidiobolus odoratus]
MNYESSPNLDRSPSLSSNSSGASSAGTLPPITPALPQTSTFSPPADPHVSEFGTPLKATLSKSSRTPTAIGGGKTSPWSAGHRTGGGAKSFDAARAAFTSMERDSDGNGRSSPVLRTTPFGSVRGGGGTDSPSPGQASWARSGSPVRPSSPFKREDGLPSPAPANSPFAFPVSASPSAAQRMSTSPTRMASPTRSARPPLPTIPSDRPAMSPQPNYGSPSFTTSPNLGHAQRERVLSSAIFSSRDRPSSPALPNSTEFASIDRGIGSIRSTVGRGGHKRAMTLPHNSLGANGLPTMMAPSASQPGGLDATAMQVAGLSIEEDVPGLPGRARLSRPAESASPFAPSAVFNSSHALDRAAAGSIARREPPKRSQTVMLPSQTVRAIDRQRKDLVAYEYLCHLAEARQWLEDNITTRSDPTVPLWGEEINDFEKDLRNGYALAHLARSLGSEACQGPIYNDTVRHFRHTANINIFFQLVDEVELPELFRFETVDLYDGKNLPKVIYCIHALALLMARQGLTTTMENLYGKVEFTDDELNAMQKGLSGVRMPNFGGIGKALDKHEPEPETSEQRQERELAAALPGIIGLQASAKGALARRRFTAMLHHARTLEHQRLKEEEEARRLAAEEEERRRREEEKEAERKRLAEEAERRRIAEEAERRRFAEEEERRRLAEEAERRRIAEAEEAERRRIAEEEERQRLAEEEEERQYQAAVQEAARTLVGFQAIARGALERRRFFAPIEQLAQRHSAVVGFQAAARAALVRCQHQRQKIAFVDTSSDIVGFQSACRAFLAREKLLTRIRELRSAETFIVGVQALIRGQLARKAFATKARDLRKTEVVRSVGGLQSLARAALARRRVHTQRQELGFVEPDVVGIQAQTRGWLGRAAFLEWRDNVYRNEGTVVYLQSLMRGALARRRYWDLHRHFHKNLSQVVRLQAAIRSRRQGSQYRQLRVGTNVPVSTIKNFMRLLDDSEFDYRGELQVESLRKELVSHIRESQDLEDDVKDLDKKIALLVKNKISHEVARAQRSSAGALAPLQRTSLLSAAKDPFAEGGLDPQTQRKLDLYQQLFMYLQTKPAYLARLFANAGSMGISERVQKAMETTTFIVFGYAQGHREEYLFLKLLQRSVLEELASVPDMSSFIRGQFAFVRLLTKYGQGVGQKQYFSDTLGPQIKTVIEKRGLDLGTDPLAIYRSQIAEEEMRTGVTSQRPKDVDYRQAVGDQATNKIFVQHLIALRQTTDAFLTAICNSTNTFPFGLRYIAREIFRALRGKFKGEQEAECLRVTGYLVYFRLLHPAIISPEQYGMVETVLPHAQRQNLAEVSKMLNQIAVGRLFGQDQPYLTPMNDFLAQSTPRFSNWIYHLIKVDDAETHFRTDEYVDAAAARQPVIYISPNDIYSTHSVMVDGLDTIAPEEEDPVRKIIIELGGAPAGSSAELMRARADQIALTLATRLAPQDDADAVNKRLFNQAKRRILAVLKIHHGNDLEAVLAQHVTSEDEVAWSRIVEEEEMEERRRAHAERRAPAQHVDNIHNMAFAELKAAALGDILQLRKLGRVSRDDKYQAILNAIANDIRSKHHRRVQRQNELQTMHRTLNTVKEKKRYLDDQIKSYHVYIDQSMSNIQKKSKKRLVLPWSMQARHERELAKEGKKVAFGSYKYSAQALYDRGILLSIDQYSPKQFDRISLTISSDEVGVFEVKAAYAGVTVAAVELKLEDLLEMQFVGKQTVLIGDAAKCSLNLLVGLINRKFYQ